MPADDDDELDYGDEVNPLDDDNRGSDGEGQKSTGSVNSAKERARASGMTIDTKKSAEEEKVMGDQKVIEVDSGPLYD